jgi:biopolymer transport protein ExbD
MAFAPSKAKKNPKKEAEMPNLTTMMDMMTIILLFLLKTLAMTGALMQPNRDIELPTSTITGNPQRFLSFVVIPDQGIFVDKEGYLGAQLATPEQMEDVTTLFYPSLQVYLDSIKAVDLEVGRSERSIITVQGDRNLKYKTIYKFISTCGEAGFSTIQFIIAQKG